MNNKGFTIIELLAVMIIILSIGSLIGAILFASLRGTTKTNTLTSVRQNGNFALTLTAKMIREANKFEGVSINGTDYAASCVTNPAITPTPTPVHYKYIKITSHDLGQTTFSCSKVNAIDTIASQSGSLSPVSLLDTTSVLVTSCFITCAQSTAGQLPTIGIQFELTQYAPTGTQLLPEKTAKIPFQSSVTLRNAGR